MVKEKSIKKFRSVGIFIPDHDRLVNAKERTGKGIAFMVREALEGYFNLNGKTIVNVSKK